MEDFIKQFECNDLNVRKFKLKGNQFKNPLETIVVPLLTQKKKKKTICKIHG